MPSRTRVWISSIAGLAFALVGCRAEPTTTLPTEPEPTPSASAGLTSNQLAGPVGPPTRWTIDGTTLAADPSLPLTLDQALRQSGRASEDVQDHILVDINGDTLLDAVVLMPAIAVAGAYDHLVLLSDGSSARVHTLAELVPGASFSAAVVPIVDGPTLVAVAPRIGGCERGPEWTFLRPTGAMLEPVGTVRIDDYDCAVADASVEFERLDDGRVVAVIARHAGKVTRYVWDSSVGSFVIAND